MSYCAMNGVEVKIPERALRPREPAPPPPSTTMRAPMVATRMLRPRTKSETALVGVNVKACLARVKTLKAQQRGCESRLKTLVDQLKRTSSTLSPSALKALQTQIDKLLKQIEALAAQANDSAMTAIKGGASQDAVRVAAGDAPIERTPVASAPAARQTFFCSLRFQPTLPPGSPEPSAFWVKYCDSNFEKFSDRLSCTMLLPPPPELWMLVTLTSVSLIFR